jgi:hypothetical protein
MMSKAGDDNLENLRGVPNVFRETISDELFVLVLVLTHVNEVLGV